MLALGIDIGSTNTKAVLVRVRPGDRVFRDADVVGLASAPTPADAGDLVRSVLRLVTDVTGRADEPPAVVGVASMAESGVPLDGDGEPLTAILRWDGARAQDQARGLAATLGAGAVFAATGVRLAAKTPLATWAWLGQDDRGVLARMDRWAGVADLVGLAMTGRLLTDHTLAGRTGAYRLPGPDGALPAGFDAELLAAVGLRPGVLPEVALPDAPPGAVVVSAAFAEAGVPLGTPVVVAGHDHAIGAWAAGVREPGAVADSLGTAEAVLTVLPTAAPVEPGAVAGAGMSLVRTVSGRFPAIVAGAPSAGALVGWWSEGLGDLAPQVWAAVDAAVDAAVVGRAVLPTGCLVLPYPSGRQCPYPDPGARLRLVAADGAEPASVPPREGASVWTRALLEGLSLHARWMLAEQARQAGVAPDGVTVLGGAGAANGAWMAIKAAVAPVPTRLVRSLEPVAVGAALLAAERVGGAPEPVPVLETRPVLGEVRGIPAPGAEFEMIFRRFVDEALRGAAR